MDLNGVEYYYIRNVQGDIIGLFDKTGVQIVSYNYDTWGKLISTNGSLASTVGVKNPYRYRGYRYDTETGLYYLQSRYYNADWGRFINEDSMGGKTGELLSHNIFAYCKNNPVNMSDPSGYLADFCYDDGNRADGTVGDFIEGVGATVIGTLTILDLVGYASFCAGYYLLNHSAEVGEAETTRVGRWMSETEHEAMTKTGKVQESYTGTTHVAHPANIEAFRKQAKPGTMYVEFNVPSISLKPTNEGWAKIVGPNSLEARLASKKGLPIPIMPPATNIEIKGGK